MLISLYPFRGRGASLFIYVYAALAAALLFYLLIPVAGAFAAREQWRRFRRRLVELSQAPLLSYGQIAGAIEGNGELGTCRFFGRLEAIEGAKHLWLRGEGLSAVVDLSRAPLYVLEKAEEGPPRVERLSWSSVPSLAEGTAILALGRAKIVEGRAVFMDFPEDELLVICYDGEAAGLLASLIAAGRLQNEYWNPLTRVSLALGLAVCSAILVLMSGRPSISSLRVLAFLAAMIPILPFLPPGLAFSLLYRFLWRRALEFRIMRDLLRLPRTESGEIIESEREPEARRASGRAAILAIAAGAAFGLALAANYALAFIVWRLAF